MLRTGIAIILAYLAGNLFHSWASLGVINALACMVITIRPAQRMQAAIGGVFLAALICNIALGIATVLALKVNVDAYHNSLIDLQFLQAALYAAWGVGRGAQMVRNRLSRRRRPVFNPMSLASME